MGKPSQGIWFKAREIGVKNLCILLKFYASRTRVEVMIGKFSSHALRQQESISMMRSLHWGHAKRCDDNNFHVRYFYPQLPTGFMWYNKVDLRWQFSFALSNNVTQLGLKKWNVQVRGMFLTLHVFWASVKISRCCKHWQIRVKVKNRLKTC